jgi:hypothetical protein
LLIALAAATAHAREVDQFTDRVFQLDHLHDASAVLDARVDEMLRGVADALNADPGADRDAIVYEAFQGGRIEMIAQIHAPFETWVREEARVELYRVDGRGCYGDLDYDDAGLAWYVELAPVEPIGARLLGI